jgi:hypothetical protein
LSRPSKIEVSAVNLRIPAEYKRDYSGLIEALWKQRRGVKVHGHTYVAISHFDPISSEGIISKYTEIDIDGDWFDLDDFDAASDDKVEEINIPKNLRPNLSQFYFKLHESDHVLTYSSYSESRSLSARSIEIYFQEISDTTTIKRKFGSVQADVVKSYSEVEKIMALPKLRELRFTIRRPNSDGLGKALAERIEERLKEQDGDEYQEAIRTSSTRGLKPNERTKQLGYVAAENGELLAKSLVNGVLTPHTTEKSPLIEQETYTKDESEKVKFSVLANRLIRRIKEMRASLRDDDK